MALCWLQRSSEHLWRGPRCKGNCCVIFQSSFPVESSVLGRWWYEYSLLKTHVFESLVCEYLST